MSSPDVADYRPLAAAILTRAILDAHGHLGASRATSPADRKAIVADAKAFLTPDNHHMTALCEGLDLDPDAFVAAVRRNGKRFAAAMRGKHQIRSQGAAS